MTTSSEMTETAPYRRQPMGRIMFGKMRFGTIRFNLMPPYLQRWIGGKELASGLIGCGVFLALYKLADFNIWSAAWTGFGAYGFACMAFGRDAHLEDRLHDIAGYDTAQAADIFYRAQEAVRRAKLACAALHGSSQEPGLRQLIDSAEAILTTTLQDPQRLPTAQRYLDLFLPDMAQAADKYAQLRARGDSDSMRQAFAAFIREAQEMSQRQAEALYADDATSLDIDITALRRRMALDKPLNLNLELTGEPGQGLAGASAISHSSTRLDSPDSPIQPPTAGSSASRR